MMKKTIVGILILMVVQMACGFMAPAPTATPTPSPTPVPPTATATSIPPTKTSMPPTDTAVPAAGFSANSSLVSVTFTVVNESGEPLDLSWLDWQQNRGGTETRYATIPAGESYEQQSYFADAWSLRDRAGNIVLFFFATEDDGRIVTITSEAVAVAKRNGLADVGLASLPGTEELAAANARFVNNSSVELYLIWIDANQESQLIGVIPPAGEIEAMGLVFGSLITLNDEDGNLMLIYTATEDTAQTVTVSDAAVAFRFGVNP